MNGTHENPIHMRIVGDKPPAGKLLLVGLFTLAPVAIAILMQNPALRQSLQMKGWDALRRYCRANSRAWAKLESVASTRYDIARL